VIRYRTEQQKFGDVLETVVFFRPRDTKALSANHRQGLRFS
jgi:hypothetical protein